MLNLVTKAMKRIYENKVMCRNCGHVIESRHQHELRWCHCGRTAIEGGREYLARWGDDYVEIALIEDEQGEISVVKVAPIMPKRF